jgi:hypothetical protein
MIDFMPGRDTGQTLQLVSGCGTRKHHHQRHAGAAKRPHQE